MTIPSGLLPDNTQISPTGSTTIGGVGVGDLVTEFGTPLFIYDETHLRDRCREAVSAFGDTAVYAAKAFLCRAMAELAQAEGMRIDVSTLGELAVTLAAGVPGERLVMHGNNKSTTEIRAAVDAGVGVIVVDSFAEIARIESVVEVLGASPPRVMARITPGVEAHTHEYTATGQDDSKFGFTVSTGAAAEAVDRLRESPAVDLIGIHAHIGSQVFRTDSFARAVTAVASFVIPTGLANLSIGGGLGVAYVEGESAPTIGQWAEVAQEAAREAGFDGRLWAEPGRSIVATSAITVYRVGTIKTIPDVRTYVAVDGGMSDNPRPVLYGSGYETFLPERAVDARDATVRLVGKHCESGDILVREARVPSDLAEGELIATPVTGAYGHSMGSNYNKVLRPPVVFVRDGQARLVVRRETIEDLLATDLG